MSVSAWCLRSDSAVATTSSRQLGRCWKSPLGRTHFQSMRPTSSGSYTTASGSRRCSSSASVVLPAPNPPLTQMITGTSYRVIAGPRRRNRNGARPACQGCLALPGDAPWRQARTFGLLLDRPGCGEQGLLRVRDHVRPALAVYLGDDRIGGQPVIAVAADEAVAAG